MNISKSIRTCLALFGKQKIEMMRNKKTWILFLVFPITLVVMSLMEDNAPTSLILFVVMASVMPPMIGIASQVAEEREKGIIRGLIYIGVNSFEYLGGMMLCIGLSSYICVCAMCMYLENKLSISMDGQIMIICLLAIVCSMIIGAIIGVLAKNQIAVSAMTVPVSLGVLFVSIVGISKKEIHSISKYLFSQIILDTFEKNAVSTSEMIIIISNVFILFLCFVFIYRKRRNEE